MTALISRELVLNGLRQVLIPQLSTLVSADNIHGSWEEANLAGPLGTGPREQPSLLILDLGDAKAITPQPQQNERTIVLPANVGATSTTIYHADVTKVAPLTITGAAAGETGQTTAALITATVMSLLGQTYTLLLPDDNTTYPPTFAHGLKATLLAMGDRPHTRDPVRQLYAYSAQYTATYADYHTETPPLVREVILQETFTMGVTPFQQTVTRTGP